jgi:hypothetical protein
MTHDLSNAFLAAQFSSNGGLSSLANLAAGETYPIASDAFEVVTDQGRFSNAGAAPAACHGGEGWRRYEFEAGFCRITLEYQFKAAQPWLKRRLILSHLRRRLVVQQVVLGRTVFARSPSEFVNYDTFWNAPTVAFLRFEQGGVFSGIENPFFAAEHRDGAFSLAFEPSLILEAGETYETEYQFLGVYRRTGQMLADHVPVSCHQPRPRFRNPCGYIPLDRAEIRGMQEFARDYLGLSADRFQFILYNFFYPLPQMPKAGSPEEAVHLKMIDTFHELGGDLILLNPMDPYRLPSGSMDSYWDLGPEGSAAKNIMDYAAGKGLRFGYYMGCARHGDQGNAAALPYAPEKTGWKKVDDTGKAAAENCMACDGYADWFFAVQRNTIEHFRLDLWSWDPGPGNGLFCHSDQHGHLPGKGAYKGWRNATHLMRRLKETFPGIYFQAFYGRKEHGLWGFKYFDQYESYWEWGPYTNATMHPDVHADRLNADGTRFQSWWNQNFRFHPSLLNHCMLHRFQEGVWDPRLVKAWDQLGWKYSVMSCLAAGGDITTVILPESNDLVPGLKEFYRTWLPWARRTAGYRKYNIPFGAQVRPGGVDGWARIKQDHGFIFLCNPGPRAARIEFGLDDEIGLSAKGRFTLKELYPVEGRRHFDRKSGRGIFAAGERVTAVVPAYEVVLLELSLFSDAQLPLAFGTDGSAQFADGVLSIAGATGQPGEVADIAVAARDGQPVEHLVVNGRRIPLQPQGGYGWATIRFDGGSLPRLLDHWRAADGQAFSFPRHTAADAIALSTTFYADKTIRGLLAAARPANLAEYEPLLAEWRKNYSDSFVGARPDRLWLVIPFTEAATVGAVTLTVNGRPVPVERYTLHRPSIHYADLTDFIQWGQDNVLHLDVEKLGADQFLGPFLDYPPAGRIEGVTPALAASQPPELVYDGPVDADMPRRVPSGADLGPRAPVITAVAMEPGYFRDGQQVAFSATVDMPAGELEGVYLSGPWQDVRMEHDAESGRWIFRHTHGARYGLIMDVPAYRVWAVSKQGIVSAGKDIPLAWRF